MNAYLGRFHLIRPWSPHRGLGGPYCLDRRRGTLTPALRTGEWAQTRDGRYWVVQPSGQALPAIAGGAFSGRISEGLFFPVVPTNGYAQTGRTLNSAYTFNSAGAAMGMRLALPTGKTLTDVYYYITGTAGTAANINDINFELRNDSGTSATPNRASPTLHDSGSADPNGEGTMIGWHKITPAGFAMSAMTHYWAIIADADGSGTDFATALAATTGTGNGVAASPSLLTTQVAVSVTNGFTADPSLLSGSPRIILAFNDNTVAGMAFVSTASGSGTRNGLRLDGLTAALSIWGAAGYGSGTMSGIEVYADSSTPGSGQLASGSTTFRSAGLTGASGALLSAPYTLAAATAYRVVLQATSIIPRKLQMGTANGYETPLRKARPGGAGWYWAGANGTTNWANDDQDGYPDMCLLIDDQVAASPGGGGLSQLVNNAALVGS